MKRKGEKVRRNRLGHAFRCKLQIWRAAEPEDKQAVIDDPREDPLREKGFTRGFVDPELAGVKHEDTWWDLWTATEWDRLCREGCTEEELSRIEARAREMASAYARYKTTMPGPLEKLLVDKRQAAVDASRLVSGLRGELETIRQRADELEMEKVLRAAIITWNRGRSIAG